MPLELALLALQLRLSFFPHAQYALLLKGHVENLALTSEQPYRPRRRVVRQNSDPVRASGKVTSPSSVLTG